MYDSVQVNEKRFLKKI